MPKNKETMIAAAKEFVGKVNQALDGSNVAGDIQQAVQDMLKNFGAAKAAKKNQG